MAYGRVATFEHDNCTNTAESNFRCGLNLNNLQCNTLSRIKFSLTVSIKPLVNSGMVGTSGTTAQQTITRKTSLIGRQGKCYYILSHIVTLMDALQQLTKFGVASSGNTFLIAASAILSNSNGSNTVSLVGNALISGALAIGTTSNYNAPLELHAAAGTLSALGTMRITPLISGNESSIAFSRTATGLLASPGDAWVVGQGLGNNAGGTLSIATYAPGATYLNALNILPTGSVGTGTLPGFTLDVAGDANFAGKLQVGSQLSMLGGTANCMLSIFSSGARPGPASTSFYGFGVQSDTLRLQAASITSVHAFYGSNTEFARITGSGLGLLQSAPQYTLDVNGSARVAADVFTTYNYTTAVSGAGSPNMTKRMCNVYFATDASVYAEVTVIVSGFNIKMTRRFEVPLRNGNDAAYQTEPPTFGDDSLGSGNECQLLIQNNTFTSALLAVRWTSVSSTATRTPTFGISVRITGNNTGVIDDATPPAVDATAYARYALCPLTISNGNIGIMNAAPQASLDVIGSGKFTGSLTADMGFTGGTLSIGNMTATNSSVTTLNATTNTGSSLNYSIGTVSKLTTSTLTVTGLASNNVTGAVFTRVYDDTGLYTVAAGTVGQPLPAPFLTKPAVDTLSNALNYTGTIWGTLTSGYSLRIT